MMPKLLRPHDPDLRCFPAVDAPSPVAEEDLDPDRREAQRILALADTELPLWRRLIVLGLGPRQRLGRLLRDRDRALAAEREGLRQRADFFWRQAHRRLRALAYRPSLWQALADEAAARGAEQLGDAGELRQRVIEELFVDLHCALCNGRAYCKGPTRAGRRKKAAKLPLDDRFWAHADFLRDLLPLWNAPVEEQASFFLPLLEQRLERLMKEERWREAWKYAARVDELLPGNFAIRRRHVQLHLEIVSQEIGQLAGKNRLEIGREIAVLQRHLSALEKLCTGESACLEAFHAVSVLRRRYAASLAQKRQFAEGLREVQKARVYWPFDPEGEELHNQLLAALETLRQQMQQVVRELLNKPNQQLNSEGRKLQRQVELGDSLARRFAESKQARRAQNRLAELLAVRAKQEAAEPSGTEQAPTGLPSFLPTPNTASAQDREPMRHWLMSAQDLRIKAQAVAAIVLLLLAGGIWYQETDRQNQRDTQLRRLAEARNAGDPLQVFEAAQSFLSIPRRGGPDPRTEAVWDLYSQALTQWFLALPDNVDAEELDPLEDYRRALQRLSPQLPEGRYLDPEDRQTRTAPFQRPAPRRPQPREAASG